VVFGEAAEPVAWKNLWAADRGKLVDLNCPRDGAPFTQHIVKFEADSVEIDHCTECGGVWFDKGEGAKLRQIVESARTHQDRKKSGADKPGLPLYLFQFLTNMPLEVWNPVRRRPHILIGLVSALVVLFVIEMLNMGQIAKDPGQYFMVPKQVLEGERTWTTITNAFFHADLTHLLGNLYFLWIFGDNVEDTLGKRRFAWAYGLSLLAGSLAHLFAFPNSAAPLLGASGAVSGMMGAYLVLFPRVKLWTMFFLFRFRIPVIWYLGFWLMFQLVMHASGARGVAFMAHVGGFAIGAGIAGFYRGSLVDSGRL
jgi:membrane associated rhomboid family serine protease/Zn-finger nucleic acid-binding protein